MKIFIFSLLFILVVPEATCFASGGLMCLGNTMCKSKDSGRKKKMTWTTGAAGLWKGSPDDGLINIIPSNGTFTRRKRMRYLNTRLENWKKESQRKERIRWK